MYRTVSLFLFLIGMISTTVYANYDDKPEPFEKLFPEIGYKTVEEAKMEFEQHFNKEVKLPLRLPPISFTHHFGRFSNLEGDINDAFEISYISDRFPENHYKIEVRPVEHRIFVNEKDVLKGYKLKNGTEASLLHISGFDVLVFNRDGWQYMLSVDKRVSDKVTPDILVQIANSIDFSTKLNPKLYNY